MSRFFLSILVALFISVPAHASDFSLVLGVSEVATTKFEHLVTLEQVGISRFMSLGDQWAVIPVVMFEASPGTDVWDLAGGVIIERTLTESVFLDLSVLGLWDPSQGESIFFGGVGIGPTFALSNGHLVSPSFCVLRGAGETVLNPAIAWSIPLP